MYSYKVADNFSIHGHGSAAPISPKADVGVPVTLMSAFAFIRLIKKPARVKQRVNDNNKQRKSPQTPLFAGFLRGANVHKDKLGQPA